MSKIKEYILDQYEKEGETMPKCGACGWEFSERTLTKHAETACGEEDSKAGVKTYAPEIDDIIRQIEEDKGEDINNA